MAVYTKVSDAEAIAFLEAYDLGGFVALTGIRQGVENSNYILDTTAGRYILTLYEKRVKEEDLPFFLNLMRHLAAKGIACPVPIAAQDGKILQRLAGRPAAITSFLKGYGLTRIIPEDLFELGKALAGLHLASADFTGKRANSLNPEAWQQLGKACLGKADTVSVGLAKIITDELIYIPQHWPADLPSGIIHADLFHDNVFFDGAKCCGLIDFYFACNDFWAYDISICLNAWCFEINGYFNITKARALIRGYQQVRPLTPEELRALPILARGSALRFLLTRLYDWLHQSPGALVKAKDPLEYLTRLTFHQGVQSTAAYGLDS